MFLNTNCPRLPATVGGLITHTIYVAGSLSSGLGHFQALALLCMTANLLQQNIAYEEMVEDFAKVISWLSQGLP